ncbi:MAG: soj protein [Candidatus Xenolissoclinum pacificiensis L6]|uniref:Chromosome partitioning protein ParA n=1 Tax=Candidatus Xenolissoclinum pacificiensis L6 TaxID=1401685 RepID=W2V060_9RICK|nr:MAG: soj protein [Candidatus Xenolissoclinum pacificiensis L6]
MKTISIVNQKGGVGKTTTSINLSTAFAAINKKTLIIDLDPQGNSSTGLGINYDERKKNIYHALIGECDINDVIIQTSIPSLNIVCADVNLSAAEIDLLQVRGREKVLKNILTKLKSSYDFIFIDCPPSLNLLTVNAMSASDSLLIPIQCEFFALEGLSHLLYTITLFKKNLNKSLYIEGVILTMYDRRNKITEQVEYEIRKHMKDKVFKTVIPRNIRLSEAPSHGKPIVMYDIKSSGAIAYLKITREILERNNINIRKEEKCTNQD